MINSSKSVATQPRQVDFKELVGKMTPAELSSLVNSQQTYLDNYLKYDLESDEGLLVSFLKANDETTTITFLESLQENVFGQTYLSSMKLKLFRHCLKAEKFSVLGYLVSLSAVEVFCDFLSNLDDYPDISQTKFIQILNVFYESNFDINVVTSSHIPLLSLLIQSDFFTVELLVYIIGKNKTPLNWNLVSNDFLSRSFQSPVHELVYKRDSTAFELALQPDIDLSQRNCDNCTPIELLESDGLTERPFSLSALEKEDMHRILRRNGFSIPKSSYVRMQQVFFPKQRIAFSRETDIAKIRRYKFGLSLGWDLLRQQFKKLEQQPTCLLGIDGEVFHACDLRDADDYKFLVHTVNVTDPRFREALSGDFLNQAASFNCASIVDKYTPPGKLSHHKGSFFPVQLVLDVPAECVLAAYPKDIGSPVVTGHSDSNRNFQQDFVFQVRALQRIEDVRLAGLQSAVELAFNRFLPSGLLYRYFDETRLSLTLVGKALDTIYAEFPRAPRLTVESCLEETTPGTYNELLVSPPKKRRNARSEAIQVKAYMIEERWYLDYHKNLHLLSEDAKQKHQEILKNLKKTGLPIIIVRTNFRKALNARQELKESHKLKKEVQYSKLEERESYEQRLRESEKRFYDSVSSSTRLDKTNRFSVYSLVQDDSKSCRHRLFPKNAIEVLDDFPKNSISSSIT